MDMWTHMHIAIEDWTGAAVIGEGWWAMCSGKVQLANCLVALRYLSQKVLMQLRSTPSSMSTPSH
jgi:hypothetical protein